MSPPAPRPSPRRPRRARAALARAALPASARRVRPASTTSAVAHLGAALAGAALALAGALAEAAPPEPPAPAPPGAVRLAAWNVEMARAGPGILLRDILRGDPAAEHAADAIAARAPDALLLMGFDWDHESRALAAFQALLAERGHPMPYRFSPRPNRGLATGADLDGDGRRGRPDDAQGWGRFLGEGGMALLSRLPIEAEGARDLSDLLWRDLPGANLADDSGAPILAPGAAAVQRLSSTGHWDVPLVLPGGGRLRVLAWHAGPPVFDGPEDRNGRRNADEARLWSLYLGGALGGPPGGPFALMGDAELDPLDGDGRGEAMAALLADPRLQDPKPRGGGADAPQEAADLGQRGDPGLDTADWPGEAAGPGNLRVDYVLPSAGLRVLGAGVDWPEADRPEGASRHAMVWVDVAVPRGTGPALDGGAPDGAATRAARQAAGEPP